MVLQKRELEKGILAGIDRLVHLLIELSCISGEQKSHLLEQAIQAVKEVTPLLLVLLGGKEEHLENLLRQLISQKLPHGLALDSFGPLKRDLDTILTLAFFSEQAEMPEQAPPVESPAGTPAATPENAEIAAAEELSQPQPVIEAAEIKQQTADPDLTALLQHILPTATIKQGYLFRSLFLDFYLPEKKLAILILYPGVRVIPSVEQLLKKEGITLFKLAPSDLTQPGLLVQKLARYK